jgi:hypothetical protein
LAKCYARYPQFPGLVPIPENLIGAGVEFDKKKEDKLHQGDQSGPIVFQDISFQ